MVCKAIGENHHTNYCWKRFQDVRLDKYCM